MLRTLALLLLALPTLAAPVIERVTPPTGFRFGYTHVMIYGSGFTDGQTIFCPGVTCPVQVFFDEHPAAVHEVTPRWIRATIGPSRVLPAGTVTGVRVVIEGKGEASLARAFTFTDLAEGAENYVQYLVPITGETVPGANGSLWKGELTFFNGSPHRAVILGPFEGAVRLAPPQPDHVGIPARGTLKPTLLGSGSSAGAFIYVPLPINESVKKSLRIRDLSRNANSWGTEIPIVSREEFASFVTLIDIPTDPQYRATLRVYRWGPFGGLPARIRVFAPERAEPVAQFDVQSHAPFPFNGANPFPFYPSYSQLDLLTPAVRAVGATIRVEIDTRGGSSSLDDLPRLSPPPPGIWAFVSVTNNETQQVTVITP